MQPNWRFANVIAPGRLGSQISKSLYEREAEMNQSETRLIEDLASLDNIVFWHRNLVKGTGFAINGYKSSHYPDFILLTQKGRIILVESKGDDRNNEDSEAKRRLGNEWTNQAGKGEFVYMMVFDQISPNGAFNRSKAKELIAQM